MDDKTFRHATPAADEIPKCRACGAPVEDPSFEEMEETLREIELLAELEDELLRLEAHPFRF